MSKIIFNREHLLQKLEKATWFIPKKPVMPAHEQAMFVMKGSVLSITATDGEKQVTLFAQAIKSEMDVSFCIPALLVYKTLKLLLEEEVTFICKNGKVEIKAGKSKYNMPVIEQREFPMMPVIDSPFEASFTGTAFNSAADTAKNYANPKDAVAAYQGICLRLGENNVINIFGASGQQACKVLCSPRSINKWDDVVIPVSAINAVLKCINDSDIVDITHNKDRVEIKTEEIIIMALCFNTKFPDADALFKKKAPQFVELNTMQAMRALQRALLYSSDITTVAKISVGTTHTVIVSDDQAYNRDAEEVIDAVSQIEAVFGVNITYMINALESFQSDTFYLFPPMPGTTLPIFIEPTSAVRENDRFFFIAPIKLHD